MTVRREIEDLLSDFFTAALGCKDQFEFTRFFRDYVGSAVLIAVSVTTDDDGFSPAWDRLGDLLDEDRFTEDGSSKNVSDSTIPIPKSKGVSAILCRTYGDFHIFLSLNSARHQSCSPSINSRKELTLYSLFIGSNGRAFHTNAILLDGLSGFESDLVVRFITVPVYR